MSRVYSPLFETNSFHIHAGLKKSLTFLQVSDMHITRFLPGEDDYAPSQQANRRWIFRSPGEIPSEALFDHWLEEGRKADCMLFTGDTIDAPSEGNLAYLREKLSGRENYLYVTGNHDWCFPREAPVPEEELLARYSPRIEAITGQSLEFCEKQVGEVTLIGLNNSRCQVTQSQYDKLFEVLERGKPTVLCCHVPLYCDTLVESCWNYWKGLILMGVPPEVMPDKPHIGSTEVTVECCERLKKYPNLLAIVAGHIHYNHVDTFSEYTPQLVTQAAIHVPVKEQHGRPVPYGLGQARWITVD